MVQGGQGQPNKALREGAGEIDGDEPTPSTAHIAPRLCRPFLAPPASAASLTRALLSPLCVCSRGGPRPPNTNTTPPRPGSVCEERPRPLAKDREGAEATNQGLVGRRVRLSSHGLTERLWDWLGTGWGPWCPGPPPPTNPTPAHCHYCSVRCFGAGSRAGARTSRELTSAATRIDLCCVLAVHVFARGRRRLDDHHTTHHKASPGVLS